MKRNILSYCVLIIFIVSCQKQIGSNGSSTNSITVSGGAVITSMQPNTKIGGYQLDSGMIAVPKNGSNQSFNYANVPNSNPWSDSLKAPKNLVDYSSATYMTGVNQNILGQPLVANQYYQLSTGNWSYLGDYMGTAVNLVITGYQISIPAQASKNVPTQLLVNFPIKSGDSIIQVCNSAINMQIGGSINGIAINGPLTITTNTKVESKNIAEGHLKIKGYADSLGVVVQQYNTTVKTTFSSSNFIINGLLSTLLSQLNTGNNQIVNSTTYRFWAKDKGLVMTREANGRAFVRVGL